MPESKLNKLLLDLESLKPEDIDKIGSAFAVILANVLSHRALRRFLRERGFSKREARLATNAISSAAWLISYSAATGVKSFKKLSEIQEK